MAKVEDQQDVIAAKNAQAEARIDTADFDENSVANQSIMNLTDNTRDIDSPSEQYNELINNVIFYFNIKIILFVDDTCGTLCRCFFGERI